MKVLAPLSAEWWLNEAHNRAVHSVGNFKHLRDVVEAREPFLPAFLGLGGPFAIIALPDSTKDDLSTAMETYDTPGFGDVVAATSFHLAMIAAWGRLSQRLLHRKVSKDPAIPYVFDDWSLIEMSKNGADHRRMILETEHAPDRSTGVKLEKEIACARKKPMTPVFPQESAIVLAANVCRNISVVRTLMKSLVAATRAKDRKVMPRLWPLVGPYVGDWIMGFGGGWSELLVNLPDAAFPGPITMSVRGRLVQLREEIDRGIPERYEITDATVPTREAASRWLAAFGRDPMPETWRLTAEYAMQESSDRRRVRRKSSRTEGRAEFVKDLREKSVSYKEIRRQWKVRSGLDVDEGTLKTEQSRLRKATKEKGYM